MSEKRKTRRRGEARDDTRGLAGDLFDGLWAALEEQEATATAAVAALKTPEVGRLAKEAEPVAERFGSIVGAAGLAQRQARAELTDLKRLEGRIAEDLGEVLQDED